MAEGVGLRLRTASLLGYASWAHFVIETRMAGTPEKVGDFLGRLRDLSEEGAAADREALRAAKEAHLRSRGELAAGERAALEAWDSSFYHNRILKLEHGVDAEVQLDLGRAKPAPLAGPPPGLGEMGEPNPAPLAGP
eukprot:879617-Prymnesium_polylepis.1